MEQRRGEDEALVARISRGDRSALEQLYRRHAGWLMARLEARCGDPDLVDIAIQDCFLAVWRTAKKYRGDGDVGAWLWGIAIRRLIDQLRKRRPVPLAPEVIGRHHGGEPVNGPDDELLASGLHGDVGSALTNLDPDLQAVLLVTAVDGLTTKEAATLLGIPHGTVKTRLQRARRQLQEVLR
ncbi:MAG: RNA polymerase sigma factor [Acidimicrobiales bacterium]|nr:RNA polymerase sigma factor [Acidimicrobiales bacterium]